MHVDRRRGDGDLGSFTLARPHELRVQMRVVAVRPDGCLVAIKVGQAGRRGVCPPGERVLVVGDRYDPVLLVTTSSPSRHDYLPAGSTAHAPAAGTRDAHALLSTDPHQT